MTLKELLDPLHSPGPDVHYGTDAQGSKNWVDSVALIERVIEDFIFEGGGAKPEEKEFPVPTDEWIWIHNLGYRPLVQARGTTGEMLLCYIVHDDVNKLRAQFTSNVTGFLIIY